jgi:hypothetical protein
MRFGTWAPYSGTEAVALAAVLLVVAATVAYLATRLRVPLEPRRRGRAAKAFMIAVWLLSGWTLSIGWQVADLLALHAFPGQAAPPSPTFPITASAMVVTFVLILVIGARQGFHARVNFLGALFGALAAPFVFEFPFDLVIVTRTVPEIPPDPTLFRVMYFAPLLFVAVSTIALLALSPMVRFSRSTLWALAAMFVVFALWAATLGFAYPGSAGPLAMNLVSKILAFVATLTLFLPSTREGVRGLITRRQGVLRRRRQRPLRCSPGGAVPRPRQPHQRGPRVRPEGGSFLAGGRRVSRNVSKGLWPNR